MHIQIRGTCNWLGILVSHNLATMKTDWGHTPPLQMLPAHTRKHQHPQPNAFGQIFCYFYNHFGHHYSVLLKPTQPKACCEITTSQTYWSPSQVRYHKLPKIVTMFGWNHSRQFWEKFHDLLNSLDGNMSMSCRPIKIEVCYKKKPRTKLESLHHNSSRKQLSDTTTGCLMSIACDLIWDYSNGPKFSPYCPLVIT